MTSAAKTIDPNEDRWRLRMKDLCEATGLPRQAIHFYIQQGLLPAGRKTGRNMAWYTEEHVERLRLIKKLQHEQFLPLKAIKALFDGEEGVFSPTQHAFLAGVKEHVAESLKTSGDRSPRPRRLASSPRTSSRRSDARRRSRGPLRAGGGRPGSQSSPRRRRTPRA